MPDFMTFTSTAHGTLTVTWPRGQTIYSDGEGAIGEEPPQNPEPTATLNGREITIEEARRVAAAMLADVQAAADDVPT